MSSGELCPTSWPCDEVHVFIIYIFIFNLSSAFKIHSLLCYFAIEASIRSVTLEFIRNQQLVFVPTLLWSMLHVSRIDPYDYLQSYIRNAERNYRENIRCLSAADAYISYWQQQRTKSRNPPLLAFSVVGQLIFCRREYILPRDEHKFRGSSEAFSSACCDLAIARSLA